MKSEQELLQNEKVKTKKLKRKSEKGKAKRKSYCNTRVSKHTPDIKLKRKKERNSSVALPLHCDH